MSGFGMTTNRLKSKNAGYRQHFLKPCNPVELDAALDEAAREAMGAAVKPSPLSLATRVPSPGRPPHVRSTGRTLKKSNSPGASRADGEGSMTRHLGMCMSPDQTPRLPSIAAAVLLGFGVFLPTVHGLAQGPAGAAGKESALAAGEQDYLKRVARENLGEMAVGMLAIEKGTSEAVKKHGRELVDTHVQTMKELMELASRHNVFLPLEPDRSAYDKLQAVGGADFDRLYAAEAQRLNQQAIDQLNGVMGVFTAEDVKSFAKRDLDDDKTHLKDAQDLAAKVQG